MSINHKSVKIREIPGFSVLISYYSVLTKKQGTPHFILVKIILHSKYTARNGFLIDPILLIIVNEF